MNIDLKDCRVQLLCKLDTVGVGFGRSKFAEFFVKLNVWIGHEAVATGRESIVGENIEGYFAISIGAVFLSDVFEQVTFVLESDDAVGH